MHCWYFAAEVLNQTKPSKRKSDEARNETDVEKGKRVKISENVEFIGTACMQSEDLNKGCWINGYLLLIVVIIDISSAVEHVFDIETIIA